MNISYEVKIRVLRFKSQLKIKTVVIITLKYLCITSVILEFWNHFQ